MASSEINALLVSVTNESLTLLNGVAGGEERSGMEPAAVERSVTNR